MAPENAQLDDLAASLAVRLGLADSTEIEPLLSTNTESESRLFEVLIERGVLTVDQANLLKTLAAEIVDKHGSIQNGLGFLSRSEDIQTRLRDRSGENGLAQETTDFAFPDNQVVEPSPSPFGEASQRYEIKSFLAQGGIGQVSVAIDREFNREVAFKEIRADRPADRNQVDRFWLEAQITGKLEHPGVVPVYSLGKRDNEEPYYAMRFIRGESMTEAIRCVHEAESTDASSRHIRFRKLLQNFVSVCNTIHFAHSQRVIHRDLKPDNIMLGSYGETLVVDWGIAKTLKAAPEGDASAKANTDGSARDASGDASDLEQLTNHAISDLADKAATRQGVIMGTLGYMSPEQILGWQDQIDARSDVFSLGGVLYAILVGQSPNAGENFDTILRNTLSGATTAPRQLQPDLPKSLEAVTRKAMSPKPSERYQTAAEFAADVDAFLADEPVSAHRDPVAIRCRRWLRRHPAIASTTAASIALTLVGLLVGLLVVGGFNRRLEKANDDLKLANDREVKERQRAEENFQIAESAVETYLTETTLNPELATPRFSALRKSLLETAIPFYEEFLAQHPDEAEIDFGQSRARFRLGQIYLQTGAHAKAIKQFNLAGNAFEKLATAEPDNKDWVRWRSRCLNETVASLFRQEEHREAVRVAGESIAALNGLLAQDPENSNALTDLVNVTSNLGACLFALGRFQEAEAAVARHAQLLEQLTKLNGSTPSETSYHLAANLNNLGAIKNQQKQWQAAFEPLKKSIQIGNQLLAKHPNVDKYRSTLSQAYHNIGRSMLGTKHYSDAIANFQVVEQQGGWLAATYPQIAKYQLSMGMNANSMGITYLEWGRPVEAVKSLNRAEKILQKLVDRFPDVPEYRFRLALAHNNQGLEETGLTVDQRKIHHQKAIELFIALVKTAPDNDEFRFHLATTQTNLGLLFREQQQFEAAIQTYSAAESSNGKLDPEAPTTRFARMNTSWGLAECYVALAEHGKAADAWKTASEATTDPNLQHVFRIKASKSFALAGNVREAQQMAKSALEPPYRKAEGLLRVSEVFAICAERSDDMTEQKRLRKSVLDMLAETKRLGGFAEPELSKQLTESEWLGKLLDASQLKQLLN